MLTHAKPDAGHEHTTTWHPACCKNDQQWTQRYRSAAGFVRQVGLPVRIHLLALLIKLAR
jgi:hypothetical protein